MIMRKSVWGRVFDMEMGVYTPSSFYSLKLPPPATLVAVPLWCCGGGGGLEGDQF